MHQSDIVIIDYGMGNLRSVQKKLRKIGLSATVSSDPEVIIKATKIILPGVGNFATGVLHLKDSNVWSVINDKVLIDKTPFLGICLGMQLIANHSEEGDAMGFGWIDADIKRFRIQDTLKYKVPHIGWNTLDVTLKCPLFKGLTSDSIFYFVHSFHMVSADSSSVVSTTQYETPFVSTVQKDNIFGVQFHPEKSHDWGEVVLNNFLQL